MSGPITAIQVIGAFIWLLDAAIILYYVWRHKKNGGSRPAPFVLLLVVVSIVGAIYSGIRFAFGPLP